LRQWPNLTTYLNEQQGNNACPQQA
jgi:hypothetical protein